MIRALLFDFDGLIVDTETPSYASWQQVYREHGQELPLDRWAAIIGTIGGFEPLDYLEELHGPIDREAVRTRRREHELELLEIEELRPGILDYLEDGRAPRAQDGDRLELLTRVGRPAPDPPRAGRALRRDRHRRPQSRALEAAADPVPRGARPPRRRSGRGDRLRGLAERRQGCEGGGDLHGRRAQRSDRRTRARRGRPAARVARGAFTPRASRATWLATAGLGSPCRRSRSSRRSPRGTPARCTSIRRTRASP